MCTCLTVHDVLKLIEGFSKFPFPTICRHNVSCQLLSLLEEKGWKPPNELAKALVEADDETALKRLEELLKKDDKC